MVYSVRTINNKINPEGYSLREGYQRYYHKGYGFRKDENGNKIAGHEVFDYSIGFVISPGNDIFDHALTLEEAVSFIRDICPDCI